VAVGFAEEPARVVADVEVVADVTKTGLVLPGDPNVVVAVDRRASFELLQPATPNANMANKHDQ
jgi:hypothetical protein